MLKNTPVFYNCIKFCAFYTNYKDSIINNFIQTANNTVNTGLHKGRPSRAFFQRSFKRQGKFP
ncbi:MAG TPA: hypothetical protein DHV15_12175 [Treponema sp.]|uniref:Transposase n=1 Tax=Treponema denticola (strain ATCC 35405 / DSM 14222 / CIP 103919 / JCM 8153 / KCTC 15104) TaxID=243275 RepID=Q73MN2_TREDE|nr:hypothetical protein TDE_1476 [Treponema denticola ATCC 35405]HCY96244.1 hypothetical protein [Treponema sp.]